MTFKQILDIAKDQVERHRTYNTYHFVVSNRHELTQLKRAFTKYKKECQALIDNDNFEMSEYDNYKEVCKYINKVFEKALILT